MLSYSNKSITCIVLCVMLLFIILAGCSSSKYSIAEKHLENKAYEQAAREYLKLLSPHKRAGKKYIHYDQEAMTGVGVVYWNLKKYESAEKIFERVLVKTPSYGKALFHLGLTYEAMGRDLDAIDTYSKYHTVNMLDPYRHVMVARYDYLLESWVEESISLRIKNDVIFEDSNLNAKDVAVIYFLNLSDDPQWRALQTGLCDLITKDLKQIKAFNVAPRKNVDAVFNELRILPEQIMDDEIAVRVARILNARVLIRGSFMISDDYQVTLDVEFYDTVKPYQSKRENFEGSFNNLFQMEKQIILRLAEHNDINITPEEREKVLAIPTDNMDAFLQFSQGLFYRESGEIGKSQYFFANALTLDNEFYLAHDYLIDPDVWQIAHNRNLYRVHFDVVAWVKELPGGRLTFYQPPRPLVNSWDRLNWMSLQQDQLFLPSPDSRKPLQEADFNGARVMPKLLIEPPSPTMTSGN